jgi:hypothetical protein
MTCNMDGMVAIASGSKTRVAAWGKALRAVAIGFTAVTPSTGPEDDCNDAELWVAADEVDEARHTLRAYVEAHHERMW